MVNYGIKGARESREMAGVRRGGQRERESETHVVDGAAAATASRVHANDRRAARVATLEEHDVLAQGGILRADERSAGMSGAREGSGA